ncbi:MAG TPA: putative toxin-antitoxin system toxin component, PIN family [Nitrospirota bacterium]|nr:putative toxin-antitoxin system toxin component, PIN family [Nitrospirota bacterium]
MNIVLDTNVLVTGLLTPSGVCGEIVRMVSSGELVLCLDARILAEYNEVLQRPKFKFDEDKVAALLDYIEYHGRTIASNPLVQSLPDIDDDPFLEVALAGRVTCLITGNKLHFPLKLRKGVKVLSPREFLDFYKRENR